MEGEICRGKKEKDYTIKIPSCLTICRRGETLSDKDLFVPTVL